MRLWLGFVRVRLSVPQYTGAWTHQSVPIITTELKQCTEIQPAETKQSGAESAGGGAVTGEEQLQDVVLDDLRLVGQLTNLLHQLHDA